MKRKLKGLYLLISTLFIGMVHLPFAFGKMAAAVKPPAKTIIPAETETIRTSVYDSLHLNVSGLSKQAFEYAQKGWNKLIQQGKVMNASILAIADFSQPSSKKRLYILDMKNYKVLFQTLVAHGKNSGKEMATSFSNKPASYKSSPGFYTTAETYNGSNGYSLKLIGLEKGVNDNAYQRAIVIHGAAYVNESYIAAQGYIGRSEGCPAIPLKQAHSIINSISNGTCFFIYRPHSS